METIVSTSYQYPEAYINGLTTNNDWQSPENILLPDDATAVANSYQASDIVATNFGINLDEDAVVTGITFKIRAKGSGTLTFYAVDNTSGSDVFYPYTAPFSSLTSDLTYYEFGTDTYLFDTAWTVDMINNFKLQLISSGGAEVDIVMVDVYYYIPSISPEPEPTSENCEDCNSQIQAQPFYLALPFNVGDRYAYLQSFNYPNGDPIQMADLGDCGGAVDLVFDEGQPAGNGNNFEENARCAVWETMSNGLVRLDFVTPSLFRGLDFKTPYGPVLSNQSNHDANSKVIISNNGPFYDRFLKKCHVGVFVSAPIEVLDEDESVAVPVVKFNFTGAGVEATVDGDDPEKVNINIPGGDVGGQAAIQFEDEGSNLGTSGTVTELDFVGSGVTATRASNKVTVSISGGGGSGGGGGTKLAIDTTEITVGAGATNDLFTVSIPGGTLATDNAIRFRILGSACSIASTQEMVFLLKYGATTIATLTVQANNASITGPFVLEGYIVADGATNAQKGQISFYAQAATNAVKFGVVAAYGTSAINSTSDQNLVITADNTNSGASTVEAIVVEKISSIQDGALVQGVAAQDLDQGDAVGISDFVSNNFAIAKATYLSQAFGESDVASSEVIQIDTDKIAIVYVGGSSDLKVKVGTLDRSTMLFTFGSAQTISTDDPTAYTIHKLNTNKFAVVYNTATNQDQIRLVGCTVSTNTITVGTSVLLTTASASITDSFLKAIQIDTDRGVTLWAESGGSSGVIAYTFSGTTPTAGTEVSADVNPGGSGIGNGVQITKIATNKFVAASWARAAVCTVATNTITAGTGVTFKSNIASSGGPYCSVLLTPDTNVFVVGSRDNNNDLYAATVSTTTPTFGAALSAVGDYQFFVKSTTQIYKFDGISVITVSGNSLSAAGTVFNDYNTHGIVIDMGSAIFWNITFSGSNIEYFVQGMSQNFVGFVLSDADEGDDVSVLIKGVDANQSGLIAGNRYTVSSGALTLSTTGEIRALSATEVVI